MKKYIKIIIFVLIAHLLFNLIIFEFLPDEIPPNVISFSSSIKELNNQSKTNIFIFNFGSLAALCVLLILSKFYRSKLYWSLVLGKSPPMGILKLLFNEQITEENLPEYSVKLIKTIEVIAVTFFFLFNILFVLPLFIEIEKSLWMSVFFGSFIILVFGGTFYLSRNYSRFFE